MFQSKREGGFTLLELVVSAAVVGILLLISIPAYERWKEKARKVQCISKMRAIHGGFASAITDRGEWPQIPQTEDGEFLDWDQNDYYKFWITEMGKYGLAQEVWICPSDTDTKNLLRSGEKDFAGSYVPTWFGPGSRTPFKWNQPWLVERAGFHGKGNHIVMPDGSVSESANPFSGR